MRTDHAFSVAAFSGDFNELELESTMHSTIIIGGGLGGLASGITLAAQGRKVVLIEKEPSLGGYATSFRRDGFCFDVAMHMVAGGAPGGAFYETLRELGIENSVKLLRFKRGFDSRFGDLHFSAPNDCDGFFEEAVRLFPGQRQDIFNLKSHLTQYGELFYHLVDGRLSMTETAVRFGPRIPEFLKLASISTRDYFRRFVSDERVFPILFQLAMFNGVPMDRFPAINYVIIAHLLLGHGMFTVRGGSAALRDALEARAKQLGVELVTGDRVKRLMVRNDLAVGVETSSGRLFDADTVISNANPFVLVHELIEPGILPRKYIDRLNGSAPSLSVVQAWFGMRNPVKSLGIRSIMSGRYPNGNIDHLLRPETNVIFPEAYSITAPGAEDFEAHSGSRNVLDIVGVVHPSAWMQFSDEEYKSRKHEYLDRIQTDMERHFPGFRSGVESAVLATPRTFERYTGNPNGAIMGFDTSLGSRKSILSVSRIPLRNVYFANAWTDKLGGIMQSLKSGIAAAGKVNAR